MDDGRSPLRPNHLGASFGRVSDRSSDSDMSGWNERLSHIQMPAREGARRYRPSSRSSEQGPLASHPSHHHMAPGHGQPHSSAGLEESLYALEDRLAALNTRVRDMNSRETIMEDRINAVEADLRLERERTRSLERQVHHLQSDVQRQRDTTNSDIVTLYEALVQYKDILEAHDIPIELPHNIADRLASLNPLSRMVAQLRREPQRSFDLQSWGRGIQEPHGERIPLTLHPSPGNPTRYELDLKNDGLGRLVVNRLSSELFNDGLRRGDCLTVVEGAELSRASVAAATAQFRKRARGTRVIVHRSNRRGANENKGEPQFDDPSTIAGFEAEREVFDLDSDIHSDLPPKSPQSPNKPFGNMFRDSTSNPSAPSARDPLQRNQDSPLAYGSQTSQSQLRNKGPGFPQDYTNNANNRGDGSGPNNYNMFRRSTGSHGSPQSPQMQHRQHQQQQGLYHPSVREPPAFYGSPDSARTREDDEKTLAHAGSSTDSYHSTNSSGGKTHTSSNKSAATTTNVTSDSSTYGSMLGHSAPGFANNGNFVRRESSDTIKPSSEYNTTPESPNAMNKNSFTNQQQHQQQQQQSAQYASDGNFAEIRPDSDSEVEPVFTVPVKRHAPGKLGFGVSCLSMEDRNRIYITTFLEGSPADQCPDLKLGDEIIGLDGDDFAPLPLEECIGKLKRIGAACHLLIKRPRRADKIIKAIQQQKQIMEKANLKKNSMASLQECMSKYPGQMCTLVTLHKEGNEALGLVLGHAVPGMGTMIVRVGEGTLAAKNKSCEPGDVMLSVNGIELASMSHKEAAQVLRECSPDYYLVLCKRPSEDYLAAQEDEYFRQHGEQSQPQHDKESDEPAPSRSPGEASPQQPPSQKVVAGTNADPEQSSDC